MACRNELIRHILRNNGIYWKLFWCPKRSLLNNEYRISIELKNHRRQYTCLTFENLLTLIQSVPIEERCFYEHISNDDSVKFYIDYEYNKNEFNTKIDVEKALLTITKLFLDNIRILSNNENITIEDMILLESSNEKKESYHLILANMNVRFFNNSYLHKFVTNIVYGIIVCYLS